MSSVSSQDKNMCSICLEPASQDVTTTPCVHKFHSTCLNTWTSHRLNATCPMCRGHLSNGSSDEPSYSSYYLGSFQEHKQQLIALNERLRQLISEAQINNNQIAALVGDAYDTNRSLIALQGDVTRLHQAAVTLTE